jgi:5'-nucleotidase (lipoprotein e(P4) family)
MGLFSKSLLDKGHDSAWASWWLASIAGVIAAALVFFVNRHARLPWPPFHWSLGLCLLLVGALLALHVTGYFAYVWEEQEVSKRVYGYFVTNDALEQKHPGISDGVHWFTESAERKGAYKEIFELAKRQVEGKAKALPKGSWGVVMDIDETILDNSAYQAEVEKDGKGFDPSTWDNFVFKKKSPALTGAVDFIHYVQLTLGGRVALVTNRVATQCGVTKENLAAVGVTVESVLCAQPSVTDKNPRFDDIATGAMGNPPMKVVAWIGDNIQDLPKSTQDHFDEERIGSDYFVLPNPMYGSWQKKATP